MSTCHDIEPLLGRLADDDLDAASRVHVDAHLEACPSCRRLAAVQVDVRDLLVARADGLRARASDRLQARVEAGVAARRRRAAWNPFRMPVAAAAALTLVVMGIYAVTGASTTVLAAQLALDHVKCVTIVRDGEPAGLDSHRVGHEWHERYDWTPRIPDVPAEMATRLISVRRCLYGHGHLAHLLYNVNGRVVSLFVMPRADYPVDDAGAVRELFGQQARLWASGDQTYALVTDADAEGLDRLAGQFRAR